MNDFYQHIDKNNLRVEFSFQALNDMLMWMSSSEWEQEASKLPGDAPEKLLLAWENHLRNAL